MRIIVFLAAFLLSVASTYGIQSINNWIQKPAHVRAEVTMQALPVETETSASKNEVIAYKNICSRAQICTAHSYSTYCHDKKPDNHFDRVQIVSSYNPVTNTVRVDANLFIWCGTDKTKIWTETWKEIKNRYSGAHTISTDVSGDRCQNASFYIHDVEDPVLQHTIRDQITELIEKSFEDQF